MKGFLDSLPKEDPATILRNRNNGSTATKGTSLTDVACEAEFMGFALSQGGRRRDCSRDRGKEHGWHVVVLNARENFLG